MKIILTGSTGFIGSEILHQCIQHPDISSIVALSRRELPKDVTSNAKLEVIIQQDFTGYSDDVLKRLAGAEACIWALGNATTNPEAGRKANFDTTLAGAETFATSLPLQPDSRKPLRFVYVSGMLAERDQKKTLWFAQEGRRMRGQIEKALVELQKQHNDSITTFIVRPWMVLSKERTAMSAIASVGPSIRVDELAAAAVNIALTGGDSQIVDNGVLVKQGRQMVRLKSKAV
ncbi:hypothetical protein MMC26_001043 [Xylographa opegraphella]|nr:hypothetical protein [Xylographa opegraphella]